MESRRIRNIEYCIRSEELIEEYKRINKVFSLYILDMDDFKNINDKYAHLAGDYILKSNKTNSILKDEL